MAKPPPEVGLAIYRHPLATRTRPARLLHWTVFPLGPLIGLGCGLGALSEALSEIESDPFVLVFDRVVGVKGGTVALTITGRIPAAVRALRMALSRGLRRAGLELPSATSRPHVTLDYRYDGSHFQQEIRPIEWAVNSFLLVESITGQTRHDHHGEWPLLPRQGSLFPLRSCRGSPGP